MGMGMMPPTMMPSMMGGAGGLGADATGMALPAAMGGMSAGRSTTPVPAAASLASVGVGLALWHKSL